MKAINIIKKLIEEKDVNKSAMARSMGIARQQLNNVLTREGGINVETLIKMANYLDYDVVLVPKSRSEKVGIIVTQED